MDRIVLHKTTHRTLVQSIQPLRQGTECGHIEQQRHDSCIFLFEVIPSICIKSCFLISYMYIYRPYNKKKITRTL